MIKITKTMRTKTIFSTIFAYLCMLLVFVVVSCKPEEAVDETKNKLHEDPVKAVFTLQEGSIKGNKSFNQQLVLADFTPSTTPAQQIVWEITPKEGWHVSSALKHFQVKSVKENPALVYHLSIEYYNSKGQKINHQFFDLGQDKIHQHFFSLYKTTTVLGKTGKARVADKSQLPYDYCYVDQYNGVDMGATNPVGFDGLLQIVHPSEAFNLSVDLLHAAQSKYDKDNRLSPFYLPAAILTSTGQWDIMVSLPFDVDGQVAQGDVKPLDASLFQPKTVEIEVYEGHLHGAKTFHQNGYSKNNQCLGKPYRLKYTLENNQWVADKSNPASVNVMGNADKFVRYAFSLRYFNDKHEDITGQIVNGGEDQHYQHFFTVSDVKPSYGGVEEKSDGNHPDFFQYTYCDTKPWDKTVHFDNAAFLDANNPIGIKGFFTFLRSRKQFTLNIRLMRAHQSKRVGDKPSPFYAPSSQQEAKEAWMPAIQIPVNVYMDWNEKGLDLEVWENPKLVESTQLKDLSEHDQRTVLSLMKAFGIKDIKTALAEFYWNMADVPVHDGKGFWF